MCIVVYVQKSDFHLMNVFCVMIAMKKNLLWLPQAVFSYFVLHRSKISLVLTTKVTHLRSLLFRQQGGVNSLIIRISLLSLSQPFSADSGLWMLTMVRPRRPAWSRFVSIYSLLEVQTLLI